MTTPVRPDRYNRKQVAIWNRYNLPALWDWIPIHKWPTDIAKAVITETLSYVTRFRLFVYFVGNGMDPVKARDTIKEMVKKYDHKAHIDGLYKDLYTKGLDWTYWDETLRDTVPLRTSLVFEQVRPRRQYVPDMAYDPRPPRRPVPLDNALDWYQRTRNWDEGLEEEYEELFGERL